jgi:hypothetical protein
MNAPTLRPKLRALRTAHFPSKSRGFWLLLGACFLLRATPSIGQDELDEGVAMEVPFEPGIEANVWEISIHFGYFDLDHKLFDAKGLVADVEAPDDLIFADTEFVGELSFSPQLRFSRTFGQHFALENSFGTSFGDFRQQVVSGTIEKWTDPTDRNTNVITEEEIEKGSYFSILHDHALTYYPRGDGRVQPYLTAGIGSQWFEIDSNYLDGMAGGLAFSYGGGLRVVSDDLYSFRAEVRNYHTTVTYDVNPTWRIEQNLQGTALLGLPVVRLVDAYDAQRNPRFTPQELQEIFARLGMSVPAELPERVPIPVSSYDSIDYTNLYISLGFTASF